MGILSAFDTYPLVPIGRERQVRHGLKVLRDIQIMSWPQFLVLPVLPLDPPASGGDNKKMPVVDDYPSHFRLSSYRCMSQGAIMDKRGLSMPPENRLT